MRFSKTLSMHRVLLLGASALGLAACTATRQPEPVKPAAPPVACYGPECCSETVSLAYVPYRQYCEALDLHAQGKTSVANKALAAAIAAARAERDSKADAAGVLCFGLNTAAKRAVAAGDQGLAIDHFLASLQSCRTAYGDSSDIAAQALHDSAEQHIQTGYTELAGVHMEEALKLARRNNNSKLEAFALDGMARVTGASGDRAAERGMLEQAIALKEKTFGEDSYEAAISYANLGANYMATQERVAAREWYRRAAIIYVRTLGGTHPQTLTLSSALAASHLDDGEYKRAQIIYDAILPKAVAVYGARDERTVTILSDSATALAGQRRYKPALVKLQRALQIRRKTIPNSLGHGKTALYAAKVKTQIGNCSGASTLFSEVRRVAGRLSQTDSENPAVQAFVADAVRYADECGTRRRASL